MTAKPAPITAYEDVIKYAAKDTEHAHQTALFMWIAHAAWEYSPDNHIGGVQERAAFWHRSPRLHTGGDYVTFSPTQIEQLASPLFFAIPNGGMRDKVTAGRLKAEGVKTGVADLCLAVPRMARLGVLGHQHGLYIEMKRPTSAERKTASGAKSRGGKPSDAQLAFRDAVTAQGYAWELAMSWHEALEALWTYLNG